MKREQKMTVRRVKQETYYKLERYVENYVKNKRREMRAINEHVKTKMLKNNSEMHREKKYIYLGILRLYVILTEITHIN